MGDGVGWREAGSFIPTALLLQEEDLFAYYCAK